MSLMLPASYITYLNQHTITFLDIANCEVALTVTVCTIYVMIHFLFTLSICFCRGCKRTKEVGTW